MQRRTQYDLAVAYRIYPKVSKIPAAFPDSKLKLASLCLRSFRRSLGPLRAKIFALLDGCPPEFERLFRDCFDPEDLELIRLQGIGNQATFVRQIEILLEQDASPIVYFAEDDYFYLPNQFSRVLSFLHAFPDADFVSAYDHPDVYSSPLHQAAQNIRWHQDRHWRTAASTCLTFLTRKQTLSETRRVFESYGRRNLDVALWMSLTKQTVFNPVRVWRSFRVKRAMAGYVAAAWYHCWRQILLGQRRRLWIPVPAVATHMEKAFLSPGVNWSAAFAELEANAAQ
jgi:hypothetical protein